jgi:ribosomal protein L19E
MKKHINRMLKIKGHKLFLSPYEFKNVSVMTTKARIKRLIGNNSFLYKIKEVNSNFETNQTVIRWKQ